MPRRWALQQNVPNPFNPVTVIHYDVPTGAPLASLDIYDVAGRHVRNLLRGPLTPGKQSVQWNGKDDRGGEVASGVYFYRLTAKSFQATRKMVLLR